MGAWYTEVMGTDWLVWKCDIRMGATTLSGALSSITCLSPYSVYTMVDKEIVGPRHDIVLITCSAFSLGFLAKEASADS